MTTMGDLVKQVRGRLSGSLRDELNVLDAGYSPGSGQVTLRYESQGLAQGTLLSCEENSWYVMAADPSGGKTAVVEPSFEGGPDLAKAIGKQVRVNPRFTDWAIYTELVAQIRQMSAPEFGLGVANFWTDTASKTGSEQYPPPVGVMPQKVHRVFGWDGQNWQPISQWAYSLGSVRVYDDSWGGYLFTYTTPFVEPTGFASDVIDDVGLSSTMLDIPVLGAAAMLSMTQESRRNDLSSQGDPRRANEVPAGSNMGMGREWLRQRDARIDQEYTRMLSVLNIAGSGA